jgi:hypothetical protein
VKAVALIAIGAVALVVAAVLGPAAVAGKPKTGEERSVSRADLIGVNFVENCSYSHQAPDDPIVFPGAPGASHQHTFVGNRTTKASSRYGSLRSGGTTCLRQDDTAAYWVPALYQGATEILPLAATVYYRRGTLADVSSFPNNFRMIAGDAKATSPQGVRITFWSCGIASGVDRSADVPTCPDTPRLVPAATHPVPGVLGRTPARLDRPQEPHGVRRARPVPVDPSGRASADHADLPLRVARRRGLLARVRRRLLGARRFPERMEAGRTPQARRRLPERARSLRSRAEHRHGSRLGGSRPASATFTRRLQGRATVGACHAPRSSLLVVLALATSAGRVEVGAARARLRSVARAAKTEALWQS